MKKKRRQNPSPAPASTAAEPASEAESFGPWLRRQREVRQIELSDIALESKISRRYLEALESNRFEVLPAAIFTKGFLRQYAAYVGLDAEEVVNFYLLASAEAREQADDELPDELRVSNRRGSSPGMRGVLALLLLAALAAAAFWWLSQSDGFSWSTLGFGGDEEQPVASDVAVEAAGSTAGEPRDGSSSSSPRADDLGNSSGDDASADDAAVGSVNDGDDELGADAKPIRVIVDFTGDCWVEASSDGQNRISEVRVQGESMRLEANNEVYLKVGDVGAVRLEVNGVAYQPEAGNGSVRTMIFDQALIDSLTPSLPDADAAPAQANEVSSTGSSATGSPSEETAEGLP